MTTFTARFEPIEYAKQLRNAGVSQEQADIQAQTIEYAISDVLKQTKQESKEYFNSKELATSGNVRESELRLQKEIKELELKIEQIRTENAQASNKIILWITSIMVTLFVASGLIQHFFK